MFQLLLIYALIIQSESTVGITYTGKYVIIKNDIGVDLADGKCITAYGTHAATIYTDDDNCAAWNLCKDETFGNDPSGNCLIGLKRDTANGVWYWSQDHDVDSTTYEYAKWDSNQPNGATYAQFYGKHKWHSLSSGSAYVLCDAPPTCDTRDNLAVTSNTPWQRVGDVPHYFTNCALVALDGTINWTGGSSTNRMGTGGHNVLTQITALDSPYFNQEFSVTNNHGTDCVITVHSAEQPGNADIILESWSLPIVSYYDLSGAKYYYIDQDNIAGITGSPPGNKVVITPAGSESSQTIDWTLLSVVTMDGIVYVSQKSKIDTTSGRVGSNINVKDGKKYVDNLTKNDRNNFNFIQIGFGSLCIFLLVLLNILLCACIGMRCTEIMFGKQTMSETQIKYVSDS